MTPDLSTWLLEQIAEDERAATRAGGRAWGIAHAGNWSVDESAPCEPDCWCCRIEGDDIIIYDEGGHDEHQARHIVGWNPARVLAECEAKRRIIKWHSSLHTVIDGWCVEDGGECTHAGEDYCASDGLTPCETLQALALPYADRPGYREEWKP